MTDIASILACYRSGQIDEAAMVDICAEWPEVEEALRESTIAIDQRPLPPAAPLPRDVVFGP